MMHLLNPIADNIASSTQNISLMQMPTSNEGLIKQANVKLTSYFTLTEIG